MEWLRLIGLCVLSSGMIMLLRQMHPQTAMLLGIAFGVMTLCAVLPLVGEYIRAITAFLDHAALDGEYGKVMLKAMGIVLVTQLAAETCREMDAPVIARWAEFCGRIALLGVAVPVFLSLAQMAVDMLQ